MGKAMKISAWTLALILASLLPAFFALKFYFTPERIRKLALEYAGRTLKREISLDAAALDLRGFSLRNFKIAEAGGFKNGEFLSAGTFSILPDFRALLRKEVRIKSVRASRVTVRMLELKKGEYNFSDLLAGPRPGAGQSVPGGLTKPAEIGISDIDLTDSRLVYVNAERSMTVTLSGLSMRASSLTPGDWFPFKIGFTLALRSSPLSGDFPVSAEGRANLGGWNPRKGRVEIDKAALKAGRISCELRGGFEDLLEPDATLSLGVKAFSSTDLKPYFPGIPAHILLPSLTADAGLKLTADGMLLKKMNFRSGPALGSLKGRLAWNPVFDYDLAAEIKGQTPELDTTEVARKFHSIPKHIKLPMADFSAGLVFAPKKTRLLAASVSAKSLKISAEGEFTRAPAFSASGSVKLSAGDLRDIGAMLPQFREYEPGGSASGKLMFSLARHMVFSGRMDFSGAGARVLGNRFTDMTGYADFSKDQLRAEAEGRLEGAPLKATLSVSDCFTHPRAALNADLAALTISPSGAEGGEAAKRKPAVKKSAAGRPFSFDLAGRTRLGAITHPNFKGGETVIKYGLSNISEDPGGLSGTASFGVAGGELDDLQKFADASKTAKIIFYPFLVLGKAARLAPSLKLPDLARIKFDRMEGDYTFRDGVMKIEKSLLRSEAADADSSGTVNLVKGELDLKILASPKTGISLPVPVGMTVKGPFNNPSVKPDVASLLKQPAVKDTVNKLIKGLFK